MKKQPICALLAAALVVSGLSACGQSGDTSAEPEPLGTAVETRTVSTGDIAVESTVTGSVTANRNVPVLSKVGCEVKSVHVKAGDTVAVGDPLYTLDTSDLQDTYGNALTTYTKSRELLDEQLRQAQESCDNLQALFELGAVSQNQLDQARLGLLQAENARASTLAQLNMDDVWEALNNPTVTAPIAGTVSSVGVTAGVTVAPSSAAVVVSEIGRPQVVVNVSETLQPIISVGDKVDVEIPSISGTLEGTIASVASAVSPTSALYEVHIDLPEDTQVSIGMFARATFPTESILTGEDGRQSVYIVDGDTAYQIAITTGLVGEKDTEVTSGLHGGEQLVTRGQSYLSDGAPVRVTNAPAADAPAEDGQADGAASSADSSADSSAADGSAEGANG